MAGKPFSHGGILRFHGQTFTHLPGTACYRCMFKEPPPVGSVPTCSQAGVLGAIAGMLGTIQAAEVPQVSDGVGELLTNRLLTFDAKSMIFRTIKVNKMQIAAFAEHTRQLLGWLITNCRLVIWHITSDSRTIKRRRKHEDKWRGGAVHH